MANRSYLYATSFVPSLEVEQDQRRIIGISEWNYDIPLAFRLLLSAYPKKCRSLIWDVPEEIGLVGDYEQGVARLFGFLDRILIPEIVPLREEARQFLTAESNRSLYFVLECGEIFEMEEQQLTTQNDRLLSEIHNIEGAVESALARFSRPHQLTPKRGLVGRLFAAKVPAPDNKEQTQDIHAIGLGNWSNVLYYDPNKT
jgi:hypothetical protein